MANQTELLNVSDEMKLNEKRQIIEGQEHDEELCSSSSDTIEELYSSSAPDTCGNRLLAIAKSLSLSGFQGFFREYVPVFLAGKNVYRTQNFKRGVKN